MTDRTVAFSVAGRALNYAGTLAARAVSATFAVNTFPLFHLTARVRNSRAKSIAVWAIAHQAQVRTIHAAFAETLRAVAQSAAEGTEAFAGGIGGLAAAAGTAAACAIDPGGDAAGAGADAGSGGVSRPVCIQGYIASDMDSDVVSDLLASCWVGKPAGKAVPGPGWFGKNPNIPTIGNLHRPLLHAPAVCIKGDREGGLGDLNRDCVLVLMISASGRGSAENSPAGLDRLHAAVHMLQIRKNTDAVRAGDDRPLIGKVLAVI